MLIKCPECDLQVSDKAVNCPHCGYPMKTNVRKPRNKNNKRKKLPNGFGQISEIKNKNLRLPFRVMVTVGKNENGRPICKPLKPQTYFKTYNDAYAALVAFNKNPYDINENITISELYDRWSKEYFKTLGAESSINAYKAAWGYCSSVYDMKVTELRVRHIKTCMTQGINIVFGKERTPTVHTQKKIKSIFTNILDYALEYELVDKNIAKTFTLSKEVSKEITKVKKPHIHFTKNEMNKLWKSVDSTKDVDMVLIQCYSGWRPKELLILETKNVNIDDWIFTSGVKNETSKDRTVPIHSKIKDLVLSRYKYALENNNKYLFSYKNKQIKYAMYLKNFKEICTKLELNEDHYPHDGRVQFVTMAKENKVDDYAIKYLVGHKITDITENIYTYRDINWLREEIEKIR